jgi:hypothetical protein
MSWKIQNKGFQTIFKMTWKYRDFIKKNYEITSWILLDMIFVEFIYFFHKPQI